MLSEVLTAEPDGAGVLAAAIQETFEPQFSLLELVFELGYRRGDWPARPDEGPAGPSSFILNPGRYAVGRDRSSPRRVRCGADLIDFGRDGGLASHLASEMSESGCGGRI